jgi:hypothetical protein
MGSRSDQSAIPAVVAVANSLADRAPGAYDVPRYATLAEARAAILHRSVSGAYSPGPAPLLLVASAASRSLPAPFARAVPAEHGREAPSPRATESPAPRRSLPSLMSRLGVNGPEPVLRRLRTEPRAAVGPDGGRDRDGHSGGSLTAAAPTDSGSPMLRGAETWGRSLPTIVARIAVHAHCLLLGGSERPIYRCFVEYPQPDSNRRSPA